MAIDREAYRMRQRMMPEHMANLDRLTPSTLRGAKFAVVTITDAVQVDSLRGEDSRGRPKYEPSIVLRYKEFPRLIHWLNKMAVNILADEFGEEESEWVGKQVPITVQTGVKNPQDGEKQDMVWIARRDEWDDLFAKSAEARKSRTAAAAPPRTKSAES